ncbi:MAG: lipoyl(octanoyl) transferase LipB [Sphingobacteriales bacterium]|nr:lipoyl(octanoyl) transferase LipB [Sphingobacteriales bacterium]
MMKKVIFHDLGRISYSPAFDIQEKIFQYNISVKTGKKSDSVIQNCFLICEHNHVITLGKSGDAGNLLFGREHLKNQGVEFFHTTRGGDITYHGPGQIVGYPIIDLEAFHLSVRQYAEALEEMIILTLDHYQLKGGRIKGMTGVWLDHDHPVKARKICAMGIKVSRYITMHGFAFNVNTDLNYFNLIIPCGITGKSVTSLQKELQREIDMEEAKRYVKQSFEKVFGTMLVNDNPIKMINL